MSSWILEHCRRVFFHLFLRTFYPYQKVCHLYSMWTLRRCRKVPGYCELFDLVGRLHCLDVTESWAFLECCQKVALRSLLTYECCFHHRPSDTSKVIQWAFQPAHKAYYASEKVIIGSYALVLTSLLSSKGKSFLDIVERYPLSSLKGLGPFHIVECIPSTFSKGRFEFFFFCPLFAIFWLKRKVNSSSNNYLIFFADFWALLSS